MKLSNHLVLCRPLLLLPSIHPLIWVFSNELALYIGWPNYWSFSISPYNKYFIYIITLYIKQFCIDIITIYVYTYVYMCVYIYIYLEGNGKPLQYSCLESPMDGGAW